MRMTLERKKGEELFADVAKNAREVHQCWVACAAGLLVRGCLVSSESYVIELVPRDRRMEVEVAGSSLVGKMGP